MCSITLVLTCTGTNNSGRGHNIKQIKCLIKLLIVQGLIEPARALISQKPMFYQSIKHRKSVFYCFARVKSIS